MFNINPQKILQEEQAKSKEIKARETIDATFYEYRFIIVHIGEIVQNCIKTVNEEIYNCKQIKKKVNTFPEEYINTYYLFKKEFKEIKKDIDFVFLQSFSIEKYIWITTFKKSYDELFNRQNIMEIKLENYALEIRKLIN